MKKPKYKNSIKSEPKFNKRDTLGERKHKDKIAKVRRVVGGSNR